MSEQTGRDDNDLSRILRRIGEIEARLRGIEERLEIDAETARVREDRRATGDSPLRTGREPEPTARVALEQRIGEYWLAQLGAIVLLLGIAFLISYPFKSISSIWASVVGYLAVVAIFALSRYWKMSYEYLSKILFAGGMFLLYFATMRLHFFSSAPVVPNNSLGLCFLVLVLGANLYLAVKRRSQLLTALMLFLCFATSIISNSVPFALLGITVSSAAAVYLSHRYNWPNIVILGISLAYSAHLLLLLNNPIMGNPLKIVAETRGDLIYLFLVGALFVLANLIRKRDTHSDFSDLSSSFLNSAGFFTIGSFIALRFFKVDLDWAQLSFSSFFLIAAILCWVRHRSKFSSAVYATFGYMALSVAILAHFDKPEFFVWLGWQSLIVVSTAIWFRSKIIIVVNILIFIGILAAYLALSTSNTLVNFSYAVVALISARVLNWQKQRLELRTDIIRNIYLASAFTMILVGLNHALPAPYVSLAWLGAAMFYFGLSLGLRNIKYRYLAILTIFSTIIRVFLFDIAELEAGSRILLFLGIGVVLLAVSLYYSKHRKKLFQL